MARPGCFFARCRHHLLASVAAAGLVATTGCALQAPGPQPAAAPAAPAPAAAAPARSEADFAGLHRCMDNLLLDHGVRDISVTVDEFADPAQRADAGTREMLVAAVSGMTQRSRAIRLVAAPGNGVRAPTAAAQAGREPLAVQPLYTLRGLLRSQPATPGNTAATVLTLDLTLLTTQDMSVVPGTASRNAVTLLAPAEGRPGRVELRKFGVDFSLPAGNDAARDGRSVATRALLEVAAIEMFGRVARLPYWSCFGASAAEAQVSAEVQDWYDAMAARPAEIIGYFQQQLRTRGVYQGAIDGAVNPPFKAAVARYREALGLTPEPKLSLDFFQAYLAADHRELQARLPSAATAGTAPAAAEVSRAAPGPLAVRVAAVNDAQRFARGEAVQLTVRPSRDAFVYCFHQDENRKIARFFPNRWQRDSRVASSSGVQLPGPMRFEIVMNPRGVVETVSCFATERDVLAQLPAGLNGGDFTPLAAASLDQVRSAFAKLTGGAMAHESFQMRPR
jgi:hypothetical protein